jgi:hypothetical protein
MGYTNHGTLGDFMNITMRHTRFATLTMSLGLLVGGLSTVSVTACTSATGQRGASSSGTPTLTFENVTIDPVAVYIDDGNSRRVVGHVEPRRRARLRIPGFSRLTGTTNLRVVAVPLGTTRNTDGAPDPDEAVSSEFEPAQHVVSMLWSLSGRTLVAMEIPQGGR